MVVVGSIVVVLGAVVTSSVKGAASELGPERDPSGTAACQRRARRGPQPPGAYAKRASIGAGMGLEATCVWRISPELVRRLDDVFGPPLDTYVNGSQVWLGEDGPQDLVIEWRLHPVAGYERPKGMTTEDVFDRTAAAIAAGEEPPAPLDRLWDGLEAFAAYGDLIEPAILAQLLPDALGIAPDAYGLVDHEPIADAWERSKRQTSIIGDLLKALHA